MKKWLIHSLVLFCILSGAFVGCKTDKPYVQEEIVQAFVKILDKGMDTIDGDLERVDKDLTATEVQIQQLQRLADPALEWVAEQEVKITQEKSTGTFSHKIAKEWLAENMSNDQYAITDLSVTVENIGSPTQNTFSIIEVTDLTTKSKYNLEVLQATLEARKESLESNRQEILDAGYKAIETMEILNDNIEQWEVSKINDTTYVVSGPGLGIPSVGTWTYYKDKGEVVANDNNSQKLKRVLLGQ
jgi:coenzyme F420-reducing hydrogenase alpha subunit